MEPSNQISLFVPLLVGMATIFCTVILHGLMLGFIINRVRRDLRLNRAGVRFWKDLVIVAGAMMLALAGHLIEMALWALTLELCGELSSFAAAFYHSAGSYTTLGDSSVVLSPRWRLLGPLEASDGMLMFGITTAMIFAVVQRLLQTRFGRSEG
jgi:ion channel